MSDKHLAFLLDCPKKGKVMLFPKYYEEMKEEIDGQYEETSKEDLLKINWDAKIANDNLVKVFRKKIKV